MGDLMTTEILLGALLAFCMGAKLIKLRWNGRSVSVEGEKPSSEEKDE